MSNILFSNAPLQKQIARTALEKEAAFSAGISYAYEMLDKRYPELDIFAKVEVLFAELREESRNEKDKKVSSEV